MREYKRKRLILSFIPLLFTIALFIVGTYAWFTFYSDLDTNFTGHVVGWNIDFTESEMENEYLVNIEKIYPGMDDFNTNLAIKNSGEMDAIITYQIKSITVLGENYKIGDTVDGVELTASNMLEFLTNKYPFTFDFGNEDNILKVGETYDFKVSLVWPFETFIKASEEYDSNTEYYTLDNDSYVKSSVNSTNYEELKNSLYVTNDEEDTKWGEAAYKFSNENEGNNCIELELVIIASQYISN